MLSPAPVVWKSLMSWPIMCSRPYPRIFSAVWLHHTTWSITNIFFANQNIFWQNSQTERIKTDQETVETTCTRGGKGDKSGGQSIQRILREWIEMSEKVWDSRAKGWEVVPCVCCLWSGQCPCSCPALKTSHQLPVICPQIFLAWRKYFYHTTVRTWRPPWLARGPAGWARCSSRRGSGCPAPPGHSLILLIFSICRERWYLLFCLPCRGRRWGGWWRRPPPSRGSLAWRCPLSPCARPRYTAGWTCGAWYYFTVYR